MISLTWSRALKRNARYQLFGVPWFYHLSMLVCNIFANFPCRTFPALALNENNLFGFRMSVLASVFDDLTENDSITYLQFNLNS